MRLTRFTEYSLRVLIYLGQNSDSRVTIQQISDAYGISKNHLMKVVSNLTRLQFVTAQRGPGGGIQLNHSPKDIRLDNVVSMTEKSLQEVDSSDDSASITDTADARLDNFLRMALQAYLDELSRFTLAEVLDQEHEANQLLELKENAA